MGSSFSSHPGGNYCIAHSFGIETWKGQDKVNSLSMLLSTITQYGKTRGKYQQKRIRNKCHSTSTEREFRYVRLH
jgi:hypothetical protein